MTLVHTAYGPGEVVETKTLRGRTEYRVAGQDFDVWLDQTKLGFADVDTDNSVDLPYNPEPQYGVGPLTDGTIQPIHEIDPDKRTSPADSLTFDEVGESEAGRQPGPNPDLFAKSSAIGDPTPHQTGPYGLDRNAPELREYAHPDFQDDDFDYSSGESDPHIYDDWKASGGWHPSDEYGDLNQPYPADTWRGQDAEMNRFGHRTADVLEGTPTRFTPEMVVNDTDDEFLRQDVEDDERQSTDPDGIVHFSSTQREAVLPALMVAIPELAGAGEAAGAAGAAGAGAGEGAGAVGRAMQMGQGANAVGEAVDKFDSDGNPLPLPDLGYGWGDLTQKKGATEHEAVDWHRVVDQLSAHPADAEGGYPVQDAHQWAQEYDARPQEDPYEEWGWQRGPKPVMAQLFEDQYRHAGLDERYADIVANVRPDDPIAMFRHDPDAYINRVAHVEDEGLNPRMAAYMDLVEADAQVREAAWKDVRAKAMRLRREGRVHVKDVDTDRIYASVQGDHGDYEVMIKKGGAFGGFGGGHSITNWRCSCEWGKWAFKRQMTYVGRLCSHGYASYLEMQSKHLTGQPRRKTRYPQRKRASDQTTQDWKVQDTGDARGALDEIRDWAETPQEDDFGNMAERVEDIRDAVDRAREEGVDADQLVASLRRQAAPNDPLLPYTPETGGSSAQPNTSIFPGNTGPTPGAPATPPAAATPASPSAPSGFSGTPYSPETGGSSSTMPTDSILNPGGVYSTPGSASPTSAPATPGGGGAGTADYKSWYPGGGGSSSSGGSGSGGSSGQQTYKDQINKGITDQGGTLAPGASSGSGGSGGDYTVKPGDTLSDIAKGQGIGDYNDIAKANPGSMSSGTDLSKDVNMIHPGDVLKMPGTSGSGSGAPKVQGPGIGNNDLGSAAPKADTSAVTGPSSSSSGTGSSSSSSGSSGSANDTSPLTNNKNSARRVADAASPIDPTANPADPNAAPQAVPQGTATPGTSGSGTGRNGTGVDTPQTSDTGAGTSMPGTGTTPSTTGQSGNGGFDFSQIGDTMSGIGDAVSSGAGMVSDIAGGVGDVVNSISGILGARQLEADRDWLEAAYGGQPPVYNHKPFNGSGGENITEWGQSKDNVKDNYTDNIEDVTAEPKKTHLEDLDSLEKARVSSVGGGIRRAGHGPTRAPVVPEVVRERKPRRAQAVEAAHIPDDDFDPLAPRTAASFLDEDDSTFEGRTASVADFHNSDAARALLSNNAPAQGRYDDFSSSPVWQQVAARTGMTRTAGRNYSLAEQDALIREGDIGGASNSDLLDLKGTHYEAMNSVGLW